MGFLNIFRISAVRYLVGLFLIASLLSGPAFALDSEDSQIFIAGFNAYQKKDYAVAVEKMKTVLANYPDTPLRDMAIFWLARSSFKAGKQNDAAKYMSQFFKEYPDSPLKGTVEDELIALVAKYDKGEALPAVSTKMATVDAAAEKKLLSDKAAQEKAESAKRDAERKAEEVRVAAEKAAREKEELLRIAEAKAAREKTETDRAAAAKIAREAAERDRLAAELAARATAETGKLAAEKTTRVTAESERLAAIAAAKVAAEAEQIALSKAAAEKVAAEKAAAEKAAGERILAERLAAEKVAASKLAQEKEAREKAEAEKIAAEKSARDLAEVERLIAEKASDDDRIAAEKAAAARADAERLAAEKAVQDKLAAEKTAREKAETERLAAEKSRQEKADAERLAAEKTALERAQAERLAAQAAMQEKEKAERLAASKKSATPPASAVTGAGVAMKQRAIAEYKAIADNYPGTRAASAALAKLQELGVPYEPARKEVAALPTGSAPSAAVSGAQILSLEVDQNPSLDFFVASTGQVFEVNKRQEIPFEIVNRGNGNDSFTLDSGFPAEFNVQFMSVDNKTAPVVSTPSLAPGQKFSGVLAVTVPRGNIDGQKVLYPVKATSVYAREVSQARDIYLVASAPLLRTVIKSDKGLVIPGDKIVYRLALLNIGTATAQGVTLRLNYPPQYEPLNFAAAGFRQEASSALVLDDIKIDSGESKDFQITFQLKEDAIAQQELFCRADIINKELQTKDSFLSSAAFVQAVSGVAVKVNTEKQVVIPGQTVIVPLVVTNIGNIRDDFMIKPAIHGDMTYSFYHDLNRDGVRQANEPLINHVGPLSPREQAYVVLEIATSTAVADGSESTFSVLFEPESNRANTTGVKSKLVFSRPVVEMSMAGKGGKLKPGAVSSFDLNFVNRGSNMAKSVELESIMPPDIELMASVPPFSRGVNGEYKWRFDELGASEKRVVNVTFRVKTGTAVGTNIQIKNMLRYQDQLGNRY